MKTLKSIIIASLFSLLPSLLLAQEPAIDFNPVIDPKLYQDVIREAALELSEGGTFSDAHFWYRLPCLF